MSASLVGSEMCIRDSNRTPQSCASRVLSMCHRAVIQTTTPSSLTFRQGCLLYTSDAADDM
eukprot:676382-Alexandrium_andersonii.AAC.1